MACVKRCGWWPRKGWPPAVYHQANAQLLWDGLAGLGLECHVARISPASLTTVRVPAGVDAKAVARTH